MFSPGSWKNGVVAGGIGALALIVGSIGVATAANGGSLLLGHSNKATKTTTLRDSKGTPLSLVGKKSKPPLSVNSSKEVKHLNVAEVGGKSAAALSAAAKSYSNGSGDNATFKDAVTLSTDETHSTLVASTGILKPGTYLIDAQAYIYNQSADATGGTACYVAPFGTVDAAPVPNAAFGIVSQLGFGNTVSEYVATITTPHRYSEYCNTTVTAYVYSGVIQAARVATFSVGETASAVKRSHRLAAQR